MKWKNGLDEMEREDAEGFPIYVIKEIPYPWRKEVPNVVVKLARGRLYSMRQSEVVESISNT